MEIFDINAPIIPSKSIGNISLYANITEYYDLIKQNCVWNLITDKYDNIKLHSPFHIAYNIANTMTLVFHIPNGKLMKIIANKNYKGLYNNIHVGMKIDKAIKLDNSLVYDEEEEWYYIKDVRGIIFEPDINNKYIKSISVYVKELDGNSVSVCKIDNFERGNW